MTQPAFNPFPRHPLPSGPLYSRCCCGRTSGPWLGCVLSRPSARTWCWSASAPPSGSEWLCPGPAPESQAPAALRPLAFPGGSGSRPLRGLPSPVPLHSVSAGQRVGPSPRTPRCPGPAPGTALGLRGPPRTAGAQGGAGVWQQLCLAVPGQRSPPEWQPSLGPSRGAAGGSRSRRRRRPGRRGPRAPRRRGVRSARLGSRRRRQLFPSRERRAAERGPERRRRRGALRRRAVEGRALRTPTPSKLGRGGGGRRRRRAGGGRLPRLGWCRARLRTERAAATRGWSSTEVTGGAGAGALAGDARGEGGGRCRGSGRRVPLPSCAARVAAGTGCVADPPLGLAGAAAAAAHSAPPRPRSPVSALSPHAPPVGAASRGSRSARCVGDFLFLFYCFCQSRLPFPPPTPPPPGSSRLDVKAGWASGPCLLSLRELAS